MPRLLLSKSFLLTKFSQTARPFSNSRIWISMSHQRSPLEKKLEQANMLSYEASHRFGSHVKPHHNHICFLSFLSLPSYIRVKGRYWRNLENLLLSHPVNWLHIHCVPSPFVLCSSGLLCSISYSQTGQVHLCIAEHQGFPVLESIAFASSGMLFSRSYTSSPFISRPTASLSKGKGWSSVAVLGRKLFA